jgi:hypothetical protein
MSHAVSVCRTRLPRHHPTAFETSGERFSSAPHRNSSGYWYRSFVF